MLVRSSNLIINTALLGIQGYLAGYYPLNSARFWVSFSLIENLLYKHLTSHFIPEPPITLGPISLGAKDLVSYGLAMSATYRIMKLAGYILNIPRSANIIGLLSGVALAAGVTHTVIKDYSKSLDEQLQEHIQSSTFQNRIFSLQDNGKTYRMRIISNPEAKELIFRANEGDIPCRDRHIIVTSQDFSSSIYDKLTSLGLTFPIRIFETNEVSALVYNTSFIKMIDYLLS